MEVFKNFIDIFFCCWFWLNFLEEVWAKSSKRMKVVEHSQWNKVFSAFNLSPCSQVGEEIEDVVVAEDVTSTVPTGLRLFHQQKLMVSYGAVFF